VADPEVAVEDMQDAHRVLIDERDRLGNIDQIAGLLAAGYDGPFSYECFAPETHAMADPYGALKRSFDFISSHVEALTA
jgi:2-keto-myo-inositol isomerase